MADWASRYDEAAQDFLGDERVLAAVQVGRAGGWWTLILAQFWGLGALISMHKQKQRAARLPQMFLVAVTEERIYALALPKMSTGLKPRVVKELRRWDRDDVTVTADPVFAGTKITVAGPDGTMECQGPKGELSDRVVAAATSTPGPLAVAA